MGLCFKAFFIKCDFFFYSSFLLSRCILFCDEGFLVLKAYDRFFVGVVAIFAIGSGYMCRRDKIS